MTIDEAKKYVYAKARKNQVGNIKLADLNIYFKRAQLEIVNSLWGNIQEYQPGRPIPRKAFEMTQTISDDLAPLITTTTVYNMTSGRADKPTDFLYYINLESDYYINPTSCIADDQFQSWVQVDLITHGQKPDRLNSQINYPDASYPIAVNYGSYFQLYPDNIARVKISYLRKPVDPIWAYTMIDSQPVYDSGNSVNFELPEGTHNSICEKVLEYFGISTRDTELYQAAESKLEKGT